MKRILAIGALALTLAVPTKSEAAPIIDFGNDASSFTWFGNDAGCGGGCTLGYQLSVSSALTIDALGIWDAGANSLSSNHQVGIWDSVGTLLASTTVGPASSLTDASVSGDGQWVYSAIAPLVLGAGNYTLGAFYGSGTTDHVAFEASGVFSNTASASYGSGLWIQSGAFSQPVNAATADRYFGPNARIASAAVPEPTSLFLLGAGLAGLGAKARRRKPSQ